MLAMIYVFSVAHSVGFGYVFFNLDAIKLASFSKRKLHAKVDHAFMEVRRKQIHQL